MTRSCHASDCDEELPTYGDRGNVVDPEGMSLPYFRITFDAGPDAESPRYQSPVFCSLDCVHGWLSEHPDVEVDDV